MRVKDFITHAIMTHTQGSFRHVKAFVFGDYSSISYNNHIIAHITPSKVSLNTPSCNNKAVRTHMNTILQALHIPGKIHRKSNKLFFTTTLYHKRLESVELSLHTMEFKYRHDYNAWAFAMDKESTLYIILAKN